jgi:DnaJ-domain-containing protein 1
MSREINYDQCYQTLNLKPGASLAEIKQRYRELARRYHPDTVPSAQRDRATLQFQRINAAKEVLEAYWEKQRSAPPSALHQRFQEVLRRREEEQRQRVETPWRLRTEPPHPPQRQRPTESETPYESAKQKRRASREKSSVSFLDRVFIVLIAETSIFLILWFGYHGLSDIHTALVRLQVYTAHDLMLKVSFGLLVLALLVCGYVTGIALILLAFLLLVIPHERILRMLSGRRKRSANPFPHLSRPLSARRK